MRSEAEKENVDREQLYISIYQRLVFPTYFAHFWNALKKGPMKYAVHFSVRSEPVVYN